MFETEDAVATDLTDPGRRILDSLVEIAPHSPVDLLDLTKALSDTGEWSMPIAPEIDRLVSAGYLREQGNPYDDRRDVALTPAAWVALGKQPHVMPPSTFGADV